MKNFPTTDIILKNILFYTYFSHLYHSSRMFRDFSNTKIKKKLSNSYLLLKGITRITIFRFGIFSSCNHFSLLNFRDKWIRNVRKNAFRYIVNGKTVNNRTKSRKRSIAVRMTFRSVEIDTSFGRGLRNKRITGLDTVHL